MNCEQMTDLLWSFLDGELSAQEEEQMKAHLEQCADCRAVLEQLQTLHTSFSDLEEIPAPEGFADGVMKCIKAEAKPKVVPLFKRPQIRALTAVAACAVLFVGFGSIRMGSSKSATAKMAAPMAPMPESAVYDAAPAAESAMEYSMAAGAESKMAEAPAAMEPAAPAAPEAAPESAMTTTICPTGPETDAAVSSEGQLYLTQLPDGLEEAIGPLEWEERIEDGALCAVLTQEQAEILMELAAEQEIVLAVGDPAGEAPASWLLILNQ